MFNIKKEIKKNNLNIIFIGGNTFGSAGPFINFADICLKNKIPFCLITNKERISYPTKKFKHLKDELIYKKIKFFIKKNINVNFIKKLSDKKTIIFSVNCSWIFSKELLNHFSNRVYNYHSASLPEFRGAACHSWRLMQNKYSTYINIHKVHEKIDTGDIVRRKKINFSKNYNNLRMSYDYMEKDEKKLFTDFLFKKHNALKQGQNSFYWPRLNTNKDALIDWKWNAKDIVDFCNAFDKPFDGAFSYINNVKVRFTNVKLIEKNTKFHPFQSGIIFRINSKGYYIATNLGALLVKNFKTNTKINLGNRFYSYKK